MSQNLVKTALLVTIAISLSGCAQIGKIGNGVWGYTKTAVNFVASPVTKLLRGAPEQEYVFEGLPQSQPMKTAFDTSGLQAENGGFVVPMRVAEARPEANLAAPQISSDISFVKMGGGSNMHDWLMCEAESGGFIRVVQGGYLIEPKFETCMRAKGYKPESEVVDLIGRDTSL